MRTTLISSDRKKVITTLYEARLKLNQIKNALSDLNLKSQLLQN